MQNPDDPLSKPEIRAFLMKRPYFRPILNKLLSLSLARLRVLDLGCCRTCTDLAIMNTLGVRECTGIDREDLRDATRLPNTDLVLADICGPALPIGDNCVDFIIMDEVIEHLDDPLRALLECRRILSSGGILAVTTPNHANLKNRIKLLIGESAYAPLENWLISGRRADASGTCYLGHIREYTGPEVRRMLKLAGFEVESLNYFPATSASKPHLIHGDDFSKSISDTRIEQLGESRFLFMVYALAERCFPSGRYNIVALATR